jgi:hypothetical protein
MAKKTIKTPTKKAAPKKAESISITVDENDMKIYKYLKKQLELKRAQLKAIEAPLDPQKLKDDRYVQELILKNNIWQLEDELNAIEMILGING